MRWTSRRNIFKRSNAPPRKPAALVRGRENRKTQVHCLLAVVDGHHLAKRAVMERIEEIINCVDVASPKNLVTLCRRIFEGEPELCRTADRHLVRLVCAYAHRGARELCDAEGAAVPRSARRSRPSASKAQSRRTGPSREDACIKSAKKYPRPVSFDTQVDDADAFLKATLDVLKIVAGGDAKRPYPAVCRCIEDGLFEHQDSAAIDRFRRIAATAPQAGSPSRTTRFPGRRGHAAAQAATSTILIELLETIARARDAAAIREVLPLSFLCAELVALDADKTEQNLRTQRIFGRLLFHAFFSKIKGESELVRFAESALRPLLRLDEPPEPPELASMHASLLLLKVFAEAAVEADAEAERGPEDARSEALKEQRKRIGLVTVGAYKALAHWNRRTDRPASVARVLRTAIGLAGRTARMLAAAELEAAVLTEEQRQARNDAEESQHEDSHRKPKKPSSGFAKLFSPDDDEDELGHPLSISRPAIEQVLQALVKDEFFDLRKRQERRSLIILLRGDPLAADKTLEQAEVDVLDDDDDAEEAHVELVAGGQTPRSKAKLRHEELVEKAAGKTPPHPGVDAIHARFLGYMRRRMHDHTPTTALTKTRIVTLMREHLELVVERNSQSASSLAFLNEDPYSVFSPEERKVQFLLDVRRRAVTRGAFEMQFPCAQRRSVLLNISAEFWPGPTSGRFARRSAERSRARSSTTSSKAISSWPSSCRWSSS